jgi:hypothetical protein
MGGPLESKQGRCDLEPRQLRKFLFGAGSLTVLLVAGLLAWQLWAKPAVVDYDNLKYIQLLRTACSSQRSDQLQGVERAVTQRREAGKLSDAEWKEFEKIFVLARQGDWQTADQQAYRLEQGQLGRRRP